MDKGKDAASATPSTETAKAEQVEKRAADATTVEATRQSSLQAEQAAKDRALTAPTAEVKADATTPKAGLSDAAATDPAATTNDVAATETPATVDAKAAEQQREVVHSQLRFGNADIKVGDGPVELQLRNAGLHVDGARFDYRFTPLGADGRPMTTVSGPDGGWTRAGGHVLPLSTSTHTLTPPYSNPNGWQLQINVPPQGSYNDNSAGFFANYYQRR